METNPTNENQATPENELPRGGESGEMTCSASSERKLRQLADHQESLADRHLRDSEKYKGMLYDSWKTMAGQSKGLKRQARKIKVLKAEIKFLKQNA